MPEHAHKDDKEFIELILKSLPFKLRERARLGYDDVFNEAFNAEIIEHKKLNKARYTANTRLRLFKDKFLSASMGKCVSPPKAK